MAVDKRVTLVLSLDLHARLTALTELLGLSLSELVSRACQRQYALISPAVRKLSERAERDWGEEAA